MPDIVTGIGIKIDQASGSRNWTPLRISSKFLEGWSITGAGNLVGQILGNILTVGGSAGSYTFQVPQTTPYLNADDEYIWVNPDGVTWRTATENELITSDFSKTFVKYDNTTPYAIREIWILKSGQTLTTAEENHMRDYCQLSYWWSDVLSNYGAWKGNRTVGKAVWGPDIPLIPTGLTLSLISGGVKVDWTDNTGGTAQTEIWAQNDGGASALVYTINAGIVTKSETVNPVDLRYYKIRSKRSGLYSAFTSEVSIAMLGAEKVTNGGFADGTGWTITAPAGWVISGGKAIYAYSPYNRIIRQNMAITLNHYYRLKFTIADITVAAAIGFYGTNFTFATPFHGTPDGYPAQTAGDKVYYIKCINTETELVVYGLPAIGVSFSLDNLSLKEILSP